MARRGKRLSARFVDTIGKPGRYADGDGLYLIVSPTGAKRWHLLFRWRGKLKEMGLGSQSGLGLLDARQRAAEARHVLRSGRNPIEVRRASRGSVEAQSFPWLFCSEPGRQADDKLLCFLAETPCGIVRIRLL